LTAEQAAALGRYRARWLAIRRSIEPADRGAAEQGLGLAYQAAGLEPPNRFVWCDSPIALSHRACAASAADGANVRSALIDRMRRQAAWRVRKRLGRRIAAEVASAVNPADALIAAVSETVLQHANQDEVSLGARLRRAGPLSPWRILGALIAPQNFSESVAGPAELSWLGPFEFVRSVLGLKAETAPLLGLMQVAANVGWLQPHERTCFLSERACLLRGDAEGRLHEARGPALRFGDGWSAFAWKGVEIPAWLIRHKEAITLATIDAESNVQVRRCMIEIMTPQRYIALGGARKVAEDETGVLWRKIWLNYDIWTAVEVINATPEPDGTHRHYFLQVPANINSAREAVAWTYGMQPDQYSKLVVRT
jgi:Domain of unknown function (DUF6745)